MQHADQQIGVAKRWPASDRSGQKSDRGTASKVAPGRGQQTFGDQKFEIGPRTIGHHRVSDRRTEQRDRDMSKFLFFFFAFPFIRSNIDVRIQQAELEYRLGREELELLTLREESRALQAALELAETQEKQKNDTIFRYYIVTLIRLNG